MGRRIVALLLAGLLLTLALSVSAEGFEGSGALNPSERWLDAFGGGADAAKTLMASMIVEYGAARDIADVTLTSDSHSVGLRFFHREGRTYLLTDAHRAAPLSFDLAGILYDACALEASQNAYRAAVSKALEAQVADVPEETDVYDSLFTTSRFLEMDGEDAAAFLSLHELEPLLAMTGLSAQVWRSAAQAGQTHVELTVYQAGAHMLALIDLSAPGTMNARVAYLQDDRGLTFSAASDTAFVTDWDEEMINIERGENKTGTRADAFILIANDLTGKKTSLEYTRMTAGASVKFEISSIQEPDEVSALEVMVKKDGVRMLDIELDARPGAEPEQQEEIEFLPDAQAEEAILAYFAGLSDGYEKLLPALHELFKAAPERD